MKLVRRVQDGLCCRALEHAGRQLDLTARVDALRNIPQRARRIALDRCDERRFRAPEAAKPVRRRCDVHYAKRSPKLPGAEDGSYRASITRSGKIGRCQNPLNFQGCSPTAGATARDESDLRSCPGPSGLVLIRGLHIAYPAESRNAQGTLNRS